MSRELTQTGEDPPRETACLKTGSRVAKRTSRFQYAWKKKGPKKEGRDSINVGSKDVRRDGRRLSWRSRPSRRGNWLEVRNATDRRRELAQRRRSQCQRDADGQKVAKGRRKTNAMYEIDRTIGKRRKKAHKRSSSHKAQPRLCREHPVRRGSHPALIGVRFMETS